MLAERGIQFRQQAGVDVKYRGRLIGHYQADLLVEEKLICELKAVDDLIDAHEKQVLNYLRGTGLRLGLLLNFGRTKLQVRRLIS